MKNLLFQSISSSPVETTPSRPVRSSRVKRSVKKEVEEHTEIITESTNEDGDTDTVVTTGDVAEEVDMEMDENDVTPDAHSTPRRATPPINSLMSDAEFEKLAVPSTLLRMQQMSISRKQEATSSSSRSTVGQQTPRRNVTREVVANPTTPRHVFPPTTPGRSNAPKTPHRAPPPVQVVEKDDKQKHAEELRAKMLQQKKEKARKEDEKRAMVLQRHKEQEQQRAEKLEENRKKEEKASNFMKLQNQYKSPTRARLVGVEPRTPSSKSTATRKIFQTEQAVPTPGRGPAKRGRIEVAGGRGQKTTIAEPTVNLSVSYLKSPNPLISRFLFQPSRHLPRSVSRHVVESEPMDISDQSPQTVKPVKPKAKAKRSQNAAAAKAEAGAKAQAEALHAAALLQAEQEKYLLQQQAEEKARVAVAEEQRRQEEERRKEEKRRQEEKVRQEEKRRQEKKDAEEKAEAARRFQEDEMAKLKAIEKEEAERLREQSEREERELQETLKRQAEKKAKQEELGQTPPPAAYEMTPPRSYKAQSKTDYGLHDLNSDDETDQEDDPRKEVPAWADFAVVRENVRRQIANPPFDVMEFFGEIEKVQKFLSHSSSFIFIFQPDLKAIFGDSIKLKKRGSSAVWKSPAAPASHARSVLDEIRE